jgi:hypothetical protein
MSVERLVDRLDRVKQTGPSRWLARCPAHADRTPSLAIRELDDGRVLINCFAGCAPGDVLAAIGLSLADLSPLDYRASQNRTHRPDMPVKRTSSLPLEWSERAESIWRRTLPLRGSLGERYIAHRRGVIPPRDSHLRYLPPSGEYPPSLCAAVSDAQTGKLISLHFTRLAADGEGKAGTDRDKLLLVRHRKRGGVIRLWPDETVSTGLAIAEGIESALGAAHRYMPVWGAVDAGNLAALPVLAGIECLMIFADHDEAGTRAAQQCAARWRAAGIEVHVWRPRTTGEDACDVARRVS